MTDTAVADPFTAPPVPGIDQDAKPVPLGDAFELPPQLADTLGDDDVAPNIGDTADTPLCAKPGCTNHVTKPAKGPSPKYCDEHRGTRASRGTSTGGSRSGWAKAGQVETALNRYVEMIGVGVTFINAADGSSIVKHGPAVTHELVELGKTNLKLRRYLELVSAPGKYGPLTLAIAGMVLPILANHDLIPKLVVDLTGVGKE